MKKRVILFVWVFGAFTAGYAAMVRGSHLDFYINKQENNNNPIVTRYKDDVSRLQDASCLRPGVSEEIKNFINDTSKTVTDIRRQGFFVDDIFQSNMLLHTSASSKPMRLFYAESWDRILIVKVFRAQHEIFDKTKKFASKSLEELVSSMTGAVDRLDVLKIYKRSFTAEDGEKISITCPGKSLEEIELLANDFFGKDLLGKKSDVVCSFSTDNDDDDQFIFGKMEGLDDDDIQVDEQGDTISPKQNIRILARNEKSPSLKY